VDPCADVRTGPRADSVGMADPTGDVRVFAIQYRQEIRYAQSYTSFRHKMRCLFFDFVEPFKSATVSNIVVLNEDIGLAALGIGLRGTGARAVAAGPLKDPANLAGAIAAFGAVGAAYAPQLAYYAAHEPETSPQRLILSAATDTFVRAFMQTFSDIARDFGVYVVASNNQAEFREVDISESPEAAALLDPELAPEYATLQRSTVYEAVDDAGLGLDANRSNFDGMAGSGAAGINVYNKAFLWSPNDGVERYAEERFARFALGGVMTAADPRSNLVGMTKKTPITSIETQLLDLTDDGDMSVENTGPFPLPGYDSVLPAGAKIGFGISLPAFEWGAGSDFGDAFAGDGCAKRTSWMRCLDQGGVVTFLQPEANPGCCWADYIDLGWNPNAWQALSWLDSAWRAVADPEVKSIRYAITPHMVGNLVDLAFDGQSVIFERCFLDGDPADHCAGNTPQTFVGAKDFIECSPGFTKTTPCDDLKLIEYAGLKRETIAMAPWAINDDPSLGAAANRAMLTARARAMLAGSGTEFENAYLETAIWADLDLN
jgi:hypothetical protein